MNFRDDEAVTEVLGQVLMVGVTVAMMAGLTLLVLSLEGPVDKTHADLTYTLDNGADDTWGTGDETLTILHGGGEDVLRSNTVIRIDVEGTQTSFSGTGLTGNWTDGRLTIQETWVFTTTISLGDTVEVLVIDDQENHLTSSNVLTAGP